MKAEELLKKAVEMGASDIHLSSSRPPLYRINGNLGSLPEDSLLSEEELQKLTREIIPHEGIIEAFQEGGEVDFANSFPGISRFRVNLFRQRGSWALAIRIIPMKIPEWNNLGLPPIVRELAMKEKGLILISGTSGSGKSTTLAAMIDLLNQSCNYHILTLEDPIEYLHAHNRCIINQREIGSDTDSFPQGLRAALRQDPDVIMLGEMRDLETISTAISAAETGHLVLVSLHSGTAVQTLERIIDVFPPYQQTQLRLQLANCLQGIINQQLLCRADGKGRVLAVEVMIATPAVRNLIRENKIHQIYSTMQTGSSFGMVTMERALKKLWHQKLISDEEAKRRDLFWEDRQA
ncbi:MAG: type IV pilus twitching motility protein PilT [Syntrophomonas sp.]|uniref:type IV pilus twitching motility protein PilT n=1 Tax=Syntrophomonas sp. TaxID=2053627 RepID=UPI00260DB91C|nr:type IV pilus twitching motility protein PilT [Syntrophomonas sp.]MDD2510222.1 type IV pilus twitching motility protein PilT [Syntrophomonas sp.]MDD3879979.1 type IV pilus twitching motility protein PilT [Syntrophomonas sp.]MDD4627161.1 type IV pilus twitching motility protein PilT [Syntrophomonas sp.]